jgi:hypothetical protein
MSCLTRNRTTRPLLTIDLIEETGLTMNVDDLTMLSGVVVGIPSYQGKQELDYVYLASAHVPYVYVSIRTLAKVEHATYNISIFRAA